MCVGGHRDKSPCCPAEVPNAPPQKKLLGLFPPRAGQGDQGGTRTGQSWKCCLPLSPGHSAPDEVPGGGALLPEHQPGARELQQVCSSRLPQSPMPHLSLTRSSFSTSPSFRREDASSLCSSARSGDGELTPWPPFAIIPGPSPGLTGCSSALLTLEATAVPLP